MTTKRFLALSFVALCLFSAFTAGGCGGSTSNNFADQSTPDTPTTPDNTVAEMPTLTSVFDSPEFESVMQDLGEELEAEGITSSPRIHFVFIISDDVLVLEDTNDVTSSDVQAQTVKSSAFLPEDKLNELSAKIKPLYDSGDIIAIYLPSPITLNDVYEAVGEPSPYTDIKEALKISGDSFPELYAFAKRYNGEVKYDFSYLLPGSLEILINEIAQEFISEDTYLKISGDTLISVDVSEEFDDSGLRGGYLFQARRYADFMRWAVHIDSKMDELKAYAASSSFPLRSAAFTGESKSGELFNYSAQIIALNLSRKLSYPFYYNNSAQAIYEVYSFHNFNDKNDYYYVKSECFVKPEDYKKYTKGSTVYTAGSMYYYTFSHGLNGATYTLLNNAPKNVNRSRTLSDGTSYSTTRTTGYSIGTEIGAEIGMDGGKISSKVSTEYSSSTSKTTGYNHSATWTVNDWEIINQCNTTTPSWKVDFKDPVYETGGPDGYYSDWDGNVPVATTQRNDLASEWMWQVTNSNKDISINGAVRVCQRQTWVRTNADGSKTRSTYRFGKTTTASKPLSKPPHIIASQKKFDAEKAGGLQKFSLLCSGKWQTVSDSDWCQVSPSSGEATGGDEQTVYVYTTAFDQPGNLATRIGQIMIKDTETGQIQTLRVTQANK